MLGENKRGRGGDREPPTTRKTEASRARGGDEEMTSGPGPAAPPIPQQGTAADGDSAGINNRHTNGAKGARPEHAGNMAYWRRQSRQAIQPLWRYM